MGLRGVVGCSCWQLLVGKCLLLLLFSHTLQRLALACAILHVSVRGRHVLSPHAFAEPARDWLLGSNRNIECVVQRLATACSCSEISQSRARFLATRLFGEGSSIAWRRNPQTPHIETHSFQAMKQYRAELGKWGADDLVDTALLQKVEQVALDSQCTAFECQLARSFRKEGLAQKVSVEKYIALFASVSPSSLLPCLWKKAQAVLGE